MQGEYTLLEPIGSSGNVYRARGRRDGRMVMVRLWRGQVGIPPDRVLEKPQVAGRVQHPMLAGIEACGRESDGTWYMISELVQGRSLVDWADEVGIPPLASVVDFMHRICQGLTAAHREGLSHDALYPSNVMIAQQQASVAQRLNGKVVDIGVPAFMMPWPPPLAAAQFLAPEQLTPALRAEGAALNADARMNVYSCGCLLYYLCTGGAPYPSRSLDELAKAHAEGKLVSPSKINPQVSASLEAVIVRALAHQRTERFVNVTELGAALTRVRVAGASGVRSRVEAPSPIGKSDPAGLRGGGKSVAFDERPTSESRLPPDWMMKPISAPPPAGDSLPPVLEDPLYETVRPPSPSGSPQAASGSTPAGSFSSAPPSGTKSVPTHAVNAAAANAFSSGPPQRAGSAPPLRAATPVPQRRTSEPPPTRPSHAGPPPLHSGPALIARPLSDAPLPGRGSSTPPARGSAPPPRGRETAPARAASSRKAPPIPAVVKPVTPEISEQLFASSAERGTALPVLVAEHEQSGSNYLPAPYLDDERFATRSRARLHPVWLAMASVAVLGALGFWALRAMPASQSAPAHTEPVPRVVMPQQSVPTVARPRLKPRAGARGEVETLEGQAPPRDPVTPAPAAALAADSQHDVAADRDERSARAAAPRVARAQRSRASAGSRRAVAGRRAEAAASSAEPEQEEEVEAEPPAPAPATAASAASEAEAKGEAHAAAPSGAESPKPRTAEGPPAAAAATGSEPSAPSGPAPAPELPLSARALLQGISVRGSLATSVVVRALERIRSQLSSCYARAASAAGHNGFGEVFVEIQLDERGRAQNPTATGGSLPGLSACVADAASKLATDRPPDTGTVKAGWKVVFVP